jgi:basic membrane protein A
MKKIIALLLAMVMVLGLAACTGDKPVDTKPVDTKPVDSKPADTTPDATNPADTAFDYDAIADEMTAADGKYQIAFVTDVGQLKDKSFNQGTWEGVKRYATENGKAYKYYQPANGDAATDDDRYDAMKFAVEGGAEIVVCAGFLQASALEKAAKEFTDVKFVFIDGWGTGIANIMSIDFQEEQSGYLAGYAAVKEGFTKLGFTGGGGGANPACCRFGYGYVQGAQAAAAELGVNVEMKYSWEYGSSFSASPELQTMLDGWYVSGTEVIFACGGSMCQSAFAAAGANDGYVIGVDVDQSSQSEYVITSATKGLREAVMHACDVFYSGEWDTVGGNCTTMGASMDAVGLPTATWSLVNFTVADYEALFAALKDGSVVVDKDYANGLKAENFANVALDII